MDTMVPHPARSRQTALQFLLLFLCILCASCGGSSSPGVGSGAVKSTISDDTKRTISEDVNSTISDTNNNVTSTEEEEEAENDEDEDDAAIESVLSTISSWMKAKRKKNAKLRRKHVDFDYDDAGTRGEPPKCLPFVTLAYAQTLDGMIAATTSPDNEEGGGKTTSNLMLSSPESMRLTHHLRNLHDGILVGGSTFLLDRPRLNVRLPGGRGLVEDPIPIVLDTNLHSLQCLLFEKVVTADNVPSSTQSKSSKEDDGALPDIAIDNIRAHNPVICCSSPAAMSFLDVLEVFQDQQTSKRKPRKSYAITVFKKIDADNDHDDDLYLPIKIRIRVAHHKKKEEDVVEERTVTLLPCPMHESGSSLDLRRALSQLQHQFGIDSVMVEGGAGVLSSFLNQCVVAGRSGGSDGASEDNGDGGGDGGGGTVADCLCVTISPTVMGGKRGLPVFGGLDVRLPRLGSGAEGKTAASPAAANDADENVVPKDGNDEETSGDKTLGGMISFKDGRFVSLGTDGTFVGRII